MAADDLPGPGRGNMAQSAAQQEFQTAYLHALCAIAGCTHFEQKPDITGIDYRLTQVRGDPSWIADIDIQLKTTTHQSDLKDDHLSFSLDKAHYDLLRTDKISVQRLLVVMLLPHNIDHWLEQSEERLSMLRCAYWVSLLGRPEIVTATKTVHLPRTQVLTVDALQHLMHKVRAGQHLGGPHAP